MFRSRECIASFWCACIEVKPVANASLATTCTFLLLPVAWQARSWNHTAATFARCVVQLMRCHRIKLETVNLDVRSIAIEKIPPMAAAVQEPQVTVSSLHNPIEQDASAKKKGKFIKRCSHVGNNGRGREYLQLINTLPLRELGEEESAQPGWVQFLIRR